MTKLALGLVTAACVLAIAALAFAFNNPDVAGSVDPGRTGPTYQCLAPWDTVLNQADNFPGGEPPSDGEAIAARCRAAGRASFHRAVACWVASGVLLLTGLGVALKRGHTAQIHKGS